MTVRRVPMTRAAIKALGIKDPDSKLYIEPGRAKARTTTSPDKTDYQAIIKDLKLDFSHLLKELN